jgi:hypothetical protein
MLRLDQNKPIFTLESPRYQPKTPGVLRLLMMKLFIISCLLFNTANSYSQDLKIIRVDSSNFPTIKLSILYSGKSKFDQNELKFKQGDRDLLYTLRESAPGSAPEKGRAVYFLLEASGNTSGKIIADIKEGVKGAMDNLESEDFVNVGYFGSIEVDSVGLQLVREKFSQNHESIRTGLMSKLKSVTDTARRSDLYKNILESLEYIEQQPGLPQNKLFIVLTSARNNSNSPVTSGECIAKSKELGIPVFSITYLSTDSAYSADRMIRLSNKTGGKNSICKSQIDIINAITDFFNVPMPQSNKDAAYDVEFNVFLDQDPSRAKIDVNFKGSRQIITVSSPNLSNLIPEDYKKYLWISMGILGLIVVIMVVINLFSRKNRKEMTTELDEADSEASPAIQDRAIQPGFIQTQTRAGDSVLESTSPVIAPNQKVPSGPILLVSLNGRTNSYPITKPETFLGRSESNDVPLAEQTVTGKHAVIRLENKTLTIEDLGSTNGTFVNGERIRSQLIKHGDRIKLGQVELTLKE